MEFLYEPMKLIAPLKEYLWGGVRLKEEFGKASSAPRIAESWELSCHASGLSVIGSGKNRGRFLRDWISEQGASVIGAHYTGEFPILVKFIDAHEPLSLQVHPSDAYARLAEGERGKTECWYVIDAAPGATLVHGLREERSPEDFARAAKDGSLLSFCNEVSVKKGDVFFLEPGTLHGIGAGILICEIQQSSDTTYRVFDYGRLDKDGRPRDLHLEKALEVLSFAPARRRERRRERQVFAGGSLELFASCPYFRASHGVVSGTFEMVTTRESFDAITMIAGAVSLLWQGGALSLSKGETVFLPAGFGEYRLQGAGEFIRSGIG